MQTNLQSAFEIIFNLLFGLILSIFIVQPIVFGMYDVDFGHQGNTIIAIIFTVVSFIRGFVVRRFFNWYHHR